jgi:hypothetical protein
MFYTNKFLWNDTLYCILPLLCYLSKKMYFLHICIYSEIFLHPLAVFSLCMYTKQFCDPLINSNTYFYHIFYVQYIEISLIVPVLILLFYYNIFLKNNFYYTHTHTHTHTHTCEHAQNSFFFLLSFIPNYNKYFLTDQFPFCVLMDFSVSPYFTNISYFPIFILYLFL